MALLKPDDGPLLVASHNRGKIWEIRELLEPFGFDVVSAKDKDLDDPEETGDSFEANAEIKARAAAVAGLPALADDSGLVVPALGGEPGIYSARWAGPDKNFRLAMQAVWDKLAGGDPAAYFACALSLCWPSDSGSAGHIETFEGAVHGELVWPPRGNKGFGYDPMFVPKGHNITFGEIDPARKHVISHRANAFQKLVAACFE